jgi:hypothetical protein
MIIYLLLFKLLKHCSSLTIGPSEEDCDLCPTLLDVYLESSEIEVDEKCYIGGLMIFRKSMLIESLDKNERAIIGLGVDEDGFSKIECSNDNSKGILHCFYDIILRNLCFKLPKTFCKSSFIYIEDLEDAGEMKNCIENCEFSPHKNSYSISFCVIYMMFGCDMNITSCEFSLTESRGVNGYTYDHHYYLINSTFLNCSLLNKTIGGSAVAIFMPNLFLIDKCVFSYCTTALKRKDGESVNSFDEDCGGAILYGGNILDVKDTIFNDCKAYIGGAILIVDQNSLICDLEIYSDLVVNFDSCTFQHCYGTAYGGGLHVNCSHALRLYGCSFWNSTSGREGGGVYLHYVDRNCVYHPGLNLAVSESDFIGCNSTIYVELLNSTVSPILILIERCFFESNRRNSVGGLDITLTQVIMKDHMSASLSRSLSESPKIYFTDLKESFDLFPEYLANPVIVDVNNVNSINKYWCGDVLIPCLSPSYALYNQVDSSINFEISVMAGEYDDKDGVTVPSSDNVLSIHGPSPGDESEGGVNEISVLIKISYNSLSYIKGDNDAMSLNVSYISFYHLVNSDTPSLLGYSSTRGIVNILCCKFQMVSDGDISSFRTVSLINLNETNGHFLNCSFYNITTTSGNGGAICVNVTMGKDVTIEGCSFDSCCTTEEGSKGGGVYVLLNYLGFFYLVGTAEHTTRFVSCHAGSSVVPAIGFSSVSNEEERYDGKGGGLYLMFLAGFSLLKGDSNERGSGYVFKEKGGILFEGNEAGSGKDICLYRI